MGIRRMLQSFYEMATDLWKDINGNINTYNASMNTEVLAIPSSIAQLEKVMPESYTERYPNLLYYARDQVRVGGKIAKGGQAKIYAAQMASTFSVKRRPVVVKKFEALPGVHQGLFPVELDTYTSMYVCKPTGFYFEDGLLCMIMDQYSGDLRNLIDSRMKTRAGKSIITRLVYPILDWLFPSAQKNGPPFTEAVAISIIMQLALALRSLHDNNIHHRDLKCGNILVQRNLKEMLIKSGAKDMDFAIAISDFETSESVVGTGFWRAPEILDILKHQKAEGRRQKKRSSSDVQWDKADVYSFGMTCYEILSGNSPLHDEKIYNFDVVLSGGRPQLPDHVPQGLKDIIHRCWSKDPAERPSFAQIVSLLKENYQQLWDAGFSKVERMMEWESSLKTPQEMFLELERLVTTVHMNAFQFVKIVKEFTDASRFGWSSFLTGPLLPFADFVARERLYTVMTLQYTEVWDLYEDFVHPDDTAFDAKTRVVHLMQKVYFNATNGVWRSRYVPYEDMPWSDKLLIVQRDFVEPLLSAGASKMLIFRVAKRLLHDFSVHKEENERLQILFMISVSLSLVPKLEACIVGSRELKLLTQHMLSIPSVRLLLRRVFTEQGGRLPRSLNVFLDLLAMDLFLPVIAIFLQMKLLSWRGLLTWWLVNGSLKSVAFLAWRFRGQTLQSSPLVLRRVCYLAVCIMLEMHWVHYLTMTMK